MRIRLFAVAALLGAAAASQELPAESAKTGSVAGIVVDRKSGEGVPKAVVILRRAEQGGIGAITGADGKFTLRDVEPGSYVLVVESAGYVLERREPHTVAVQPGQTTSDVKVPLV